MIQGNIKLWASFLVFSIFYSAMTIATLCISGNFPAILISVLIIIAGSTLGWLIGIAISPYNDTERSDFAKIAGAISTFLSGYVLAKIDPLIAPIFSSATYGQDINSARVLSLLCSTVLVMLVTFVARHYA